jgi:hypothetical protein
MELKQSPKEAESRYRKAAEGWVRFMNAVIGLPKDNQKSLEWYERARKANENQNKSIFIRCR